MPRKKPAGDEPEKPDQPEPRPKRKKKAAPKRKPAAGKKAAKKKPAPKKSAKKKPAPKKKPGQPAAGGASAYDRHRQRNAEKQAEQSRQGRDIGDIPPVADPARREECRRNLRLFCETYHGETFTFAWGRDHLRVIPKIERAVLKGGLFAVAMPRGSGKSCLCEAAAEWAVLFGHRAYAVIIGATEKHADETLDSLRTDLESNELLAADFPEVCYPVACLEGLSGRCRGQLYRGERTRISWKGDKLILPTIPGSPASGSILRTRGITGGMRGMKLKRADGSTIRPDLVLPDDPQTRQSARNRETCQVLLDILQGDVLGLAGPGTKISGLMPCTVIEAGDMADQILDPKQYRDWQSERTQMIDAWPEKMDLWEQYYAVRCDGLDLEDDGAAGDAFYREHWDAMHLGADLPWPNRIEDGALDGLQTAMNLYFRDPAGFMAEYQNDPKPKTAAASAENLEPAHVLQQLNGLERGVVPVEAQLLTAFVDVQMDLLYWMVCAWAGGFTGWILDCGAWPEQRRFYFTLSDAKPTLGDLSPTAGLEGTLLHGLRQLLGQLLDRDWLRADGTGLRVQRAMVDANWGESTDVVYQACRENQHASLLLPSHGQFIGASSIPMNDRKQKPGDRVGWNWRIPATAGQKGRGIRHALYDTNAWKSFVRARLVTAAGDPGSLTLWKAGQHVHRMLADHFTSEYAVRTAGRGRELMEWKIRPERPDNHLWDCVVGNAVCASIEGIKAIGHDVRDPGRRKGQRRKLSEMRNRKRAA